jgi:hypothetical protein
MKGIQVSIDKGPGFLQRGDNHKKILKNGVGSFKHLFQNHWANFNQTWYKSSLGVGDLRLFKRRG